MMNSRQLARSAHAGSEIGRSEDGPAQPSRRVSRRVGGVSTADHGLNGRDWHGQESKRREIDLSRAHVAANNCYA